MSEGPTPTGTLLKPGSLRRTDQAPGRAADSRLVASISNGRIVLFIVLLSFGVYANALSGEFVFDDTDQIVNNHSIRSWRNLGNAFTSSVWAFREQVNDPSAPPSLPYYRPLFTVLLTIEYHLFGLWPQGWHLISLLLHALCAVGVFYVLAIASGRKLIGAVAAMLFAAHPVHAESVCWISGMTDPLFSVFYLASLCFYLMGRVRGRSTGTMARTENRRFFVLSIGLFVASLFSKETAISLVLVVFGYELFRSSGSFQTRAAKAIRRAAPFAAASLVYLIPRYLVLGEMMFRNPQAPSRPAVYTILTLPFVVWSYLLHMVWPVGLSVTYATHFITTLTLRGVVLPSAAIALGLSATWLLRRRLDSGSWFALLLVVSPLLPVLRLGQVSQEEYLVFDHYLYLSVAGFAYLLANALCDSRRLSSKPASGWAASKLALMALILIASAALAVKANTVWANSYTLWSNAALVRPDYWAAQYNAALSLLDSGRVEEARERLEIASRLKPDEGVIFDALGRSQAGSGDRASAIYSFKRAIELGPDLFEAYNNLGTVYFDTRDYAAAERYFEQALLIKPEAAASRYNLGLCYARQGRLGQAANHLERVVTSLPDDAEACYELGLVYEQAGRIERARELFEQGARSARQPELVERINEAMSRIGSRR